eukprot:152367_1
MAYAVIGMGAICFEQDVYVLGGHGGKHENETLDSVFYYTEFTDDPTTDPITMRPTGHPTRDPSKVPTARTQHPTWPIISPSMPSMPPTNSTPMTVDNAALSGDAVIAMSFSAIVGALVVVLIYWLYKLYLKQKQKVIEEDQVVVMTVNQNKPKPQQDSESKQEDDDEEGKQEYEEEGIVKNETELRQEEKSETSGSCNSDNIYEGNENSVSNSDQFCVRSTERTDN